MPPPRSTRSGSGSTPRPRRRSTGRTSTGTRWARTPTRSVTSSARTSSPSCVSGRSPRRWPTAPARRSSAPSPGTSRSSSSTRRSSSRRGRATSRRWSRPTGRSRDPTRHLARRPRRPPPPGRRRAGGRGPGRSGRPRRRPAGRPPAPRQPDHRGHRRDRRREPRCGGRAQPPRHLTRPAGRRGRPARGPTWRAVRAARPRRDDDALGVAGLAAPDDLDDVPPDVRPPRANRTIVAIAATAVVSLGAGVALSHLVISPAQRAAEAAPPEAGLITVPVEQRELTTDLTLRGDALYDDPVPVSVETADLGAPPVVTGQVPEVGDVVDAGDVVLEVAGRPVIVLPGELPVYRTLRVGSSGPDVLQLT